jgi:hypothetical protein
MAARKFFFLLLIRFRLKKVEHTYTADVKRQTKKNKIKGTIFSSAATQPAERALLSFTKDS